MNHHNAAASCSHQSAHSSSMVSSSLSSFRSLFVMTNIQPQTRVFDPKGNETFVTRQSEIQIMFFLATSILSVRTLLTSLKDASHGQARQPRFLSISHPPSKLSFIPLPPNIGCDEHLCALHAGNYRLRPKVFDEIKWLFLSYLQSYFSTLNYSRSVDANYLKISGTRPRDE